jgi:HlyD family secretion protein
MTLGARVPVFAAALLALSSCAGRRPAYSGTVQTESVAVGSQVGGRVVAVDVAAGTRVLRNSVLLRLDPSLLQAQRDQAVAQARQAAERLAELEHGNVPTEIARAREQTAQAAAQYRQAVAQTAPQTAAQAAAIRDAEAAVRDAQAAVRVARITFERTRSLAATGDVPRQSLDQARADDAQARARLSQARARLSQARSNYANVVEAQLPGQRAAAQANEAAQSASYQTVRNGTRSEEIAQARSQLAAARAAVNYARARLDEAVVRAPAAGVVESFNLHPGDLLNPNQQAAIVDTFADPYVYIYASQRDLGALVQGARLRVVSDAGGTEYDGTVEAHDRNAQFTPQNTETADQRADLVYGVKVRVHDPDRRLLAGTTVTVRVR